MRVTNRLQMVSTQAEYVRRFLNTPQRVHAERILSRLGLRPWEVRRIRERCGETVHRFDWSVAECGHGGRR